MKLYIDSREPKQIINLIANYNNNAKEQFEIIIKSLDLGDYLIENEDKSLILFERKSLADLEASIKDGRYSEQSYRLNECAIVNHNIIYLIEGSIINYKNKYFVNSLYSSLLTLNYFKGFSVLNSINSVETAEIIYRFTNKLLREKNKNGYYFNAIKQSEDTQIQENNIERTHENNENNENNEKNEKNDYVYALKTSKKSNVTKDNINIIMLMQVPNVNVVSATAIMEKYKTLRELIETLEKDNECLNNMYVNNRKLSSNVIKSIKEYLLI
tara:strand:- start:2102 stop:2914 length:813 start_codon:yes stop_codon:yes gene_type:complete